MLMFDDIRGWGLSQEWRLMMSAIFKNHKPPIIFYWTIYFCKIKAINKTAWGYILFRFSKESRRLPFFIETLIAYPRFIWRGVGSIWQMLTHFLGRGYWNADSCLHRGGVCQKSLKKCRRTLWMVLNRRYFWNWCILSIKQITDIIHLWWDETNYLPEVPPPGGYSDKPYFGCSTKNQVLRPGTGIGHLGVRDDSIIRISKFFDKMRLSRSLRPQWMKLKCVNLRISEPPSNKL